MNYLLRSEKNSHHFEKSGLTEKYPGLHAELLINEVYPFAKNSHLRREKLHRKNPGFVGNH